MQTTIRKKLLTIRRFLFAVFAFIPARSRRIFQVSASLVLFFAIIFSEKISAQVTLGSSPYTQNFNSIGSGLPTGWSVWTGATNSSLGTAASFTTAATAWTSATGQFANFASANLPSTSADAAVTQASRADRALGVRQTNSFGDPGAAFVFEIANTTGLGNFSLTFSLMNLNPGAGRAVTWNVDYGFGSSPASFTNTATSPVSLITGNSGAWGMTTVTINFGTVLNNNSGPVWIRIVTKTASASGGGGAVRPTTAIDDFNLTWNSLSSTGSYGPFCSSSSTSFNLPFTSTGTFNIGNIYTAQLSAASGSFASPTTIGTLISTANSGNIAVTIPAGLAGGTGYRIRVISTSPSLTGTDNGSNITVNAIITQPTNAAVCLGSAATFTVTGTGSPSYQWQESPDMVTWTSLSDGTFSGITYSGTTTASLTVTGSTPHYYKCILSYSGGCTVTSSSAQLNYTSSVGGSVSGGTFVCPGTTETLTLSGQTGSVIRWESSLDDGSTWTTISNTSTSLTATITQAITYRAVVQNGSCSSANSANLSITASPVAGGGTLSPALTSACNGSNNNTISLSGQTGSIIRWESTTDGGTSWNAIANTTNSLSYSNLSATTVYRAVIQNGACWAYSTHAVVQVQTFSYTPTANANPLTLCLGSSSTFTGTETTFNTSPFDGGDFNQANPKGWRVTLGGGEINFPANNDNSFNNPWSETNGPKTFNGVTYNNSNILPFPGKFAIATGWDSTTLETPVFSTLYMTDASFNFYSAYNLNAGTAIKVEVSVDSGVTYSPMWRVNGPASYGIPNGGFIPMSIPLTDYLGQKNVRLRFTFMGTAGSNWAIDNAFVNGVYSAVGLFWTPSTYLNIDTGKLVKSTPTIAGTFPYTVTAKMNGCAVGSANVSITVYDTSMQPTSATANPQFMCPGHSSTLTRNGGYLGYGATDWKWYTSSCGGTYVGSGTTITVSPLVNTTYYVRAEGYCNTTRCASVTVNITCILASENIDLKGSIIQRQSSLFWTINTDSKILYMELERSNDGINYDVIKNISVNDYPSKRGYTATDYVSGVSTNKVYYRVKVVYSDGEITTSEILNLPVNDNPFNAIVYPNPASRNARVEFYVPSSSKVEIKLFSVTGQLLQMNQALAQSGYNSFDLNALDRLSGGVYFISISNKEQLSYIKLMVE